MAREKMCHWNLLKCFLLIRIDKTLMTTIFSFMYIGHTIKLICSTKTFDNFQHLCSIEHLKCLAKPEEMASNRGIVQGKEK